jgi:hypothetical protein
LADFVKKGVPPTELKARTGELTPPGIIERARWKSCSEVFTGQSDEETPPRGKG